MTTFKLLQCGMFAATFASAALLTGCDRTVVEKTKTTQGPGGTTVQKETVVEHNDGSVTIDKEKKTTPP